jgi:hypothetical protein
VSFIASNSRKYTGLSVGAGGKVGLGVELEVGKFRVKKVPAIPVAKTHPIHSRIAKIPIST